MFSRIKLNVRRAGLEDRQKLANLIHFEIYVHRHLDWRPPLDWLGNHPYLVAEKNGEIVAALACPPDPPKVAWIRLFAISANISIEKAWGALWPEAREILRYLPHPTQVAAIPLQRWFQSVLVDSDFDLTHRVVMLSWTPGKHNLAERQNNSLIRPMNFDDLPEVEKIDNAAFGTVWQTSQSGLELAFKQAAVATVVEEEGRLLGYQISTTTPMGGHLARLAVHPDTQGQGLGYSLLKDMLSQFERRGAQAVTVNTQQDNRVSLSLYEKAGFRHTGEEYPVYQFKIREDET
jgi:ribosomal protein S18 acetylase RimI-like enzyme